MGIKAEADENYKLIWIWKVDSVYKYDMGFKCYSSLFCMSAHICQYVFTENDQGINLFLYHRVA